MTGGQRSRGFYRGTFVIHCEQVEIDGIRGGSTAAIFVGSQLRWAGNAMRIDGPDDLLMLAGAEGEEDLRLGAERSIRRLLGDLCEPRRTVPLLPGGAERGHDFSVTDGTETYRLTLAGQGRLFVVSGPLPPHDTDLVVVENSADLRPGLRDANVPAGVICFAAGTLVRTPEGPRAVETLRRGDKVLTRDSGAQEVLWTGQQRLSGARLFAMPEIRPIRVRSGALGADLPEGDLIVSPEHRLLLSGAAARELFDEPEVLIAARDLVDGRGIGPQTGLREVTYVHLLTEKHEILWANGVEAESFHPASADLSIIAATDRAALSDIAPEIDRDPFAYGGFARRALSAPEVAILRFAAGEAAQTRRGHRPLTLLHQPV